MYEARSPTRTTCAACRRPTATGTVEFTSIFPAAYYGRWPHVHFEVYPSLDDATNATNKLRTSQLALPEDVCEAGLRDRRLRGERQQPVPDLAGPRHRLQRRLLAPAGQGHRQRRRRVRRHPQRAGLTGAVSGARGSPVLRRRRGRRGEPGVGQVEAAAVARRSWSACRSPAWSVVRTSRPVRPSGRAARTATWLSWFCDDVEQAALAQQPVAVGQQRAAEVDAVGRAGARVDPEEVPVVEWTTSRALPSGVGADAVGVELARAPAPSRR